MNIYLVSQDVNGGYDTHSAMVVIAASEEAARLMHPSMDEESYMKLDEIWWTPEKLQYSSWASPEQVTLKLLASDIGDVSSRVVLSSFHAG